MNTHLKLAVCKPAQPRLVVIRQDYSQMTDTDLVLACQQNDTRALEYLLKRLEPKVKGMIHYAAPECTDIADLVQEVSIRIWQSIHQLRDPRCLKRWVNQMVRNLFYDQLRKRPRKYKVVSLDEPISNDYGFDKCTHEIADQSLDPEAELLNNELSNALVEAISALPECYKTAAVLRDVDGLSYEDIAHVTGARVGTIKSRIARARAKIQEQVSPYLRECA